MNKKWSRSDVVNWLRAINEECGCKDEPSSYGGDTYKMSYEPHVLKSVVHQNYGSRDAMCPETYDKVADYVCDDPHAALEMIKPIMTKIGIKCPQSFARALADVFFASQDMGIIKQIKMD